MQMMERAEGGNVTAFLQNEFSRVGQRKASELIKAADKKTTKTLTPRSRINTLGCDEAEAVQRHPGNLHHGAPTDLLVAIGSRAMLAGLLKEVRRSVPAATRPPAVYRGNPFQIEVAIKAGGKLSSDDSARVLRFANRVAPLSAIGLLLLQGCDGDFMEELRPVPA